MKFRAVDRGIAWSRTGLGKKLRVETNPVEDCRAALGVDIASKGCQ